MMAPQRNRRQDQKEVAKMLLRVVLDVLRRKNMEAMHCRACFIIRDCKRRHKLRDSGYSSGRACLAKMARRMKVLVGDQIWSEAAVFLDRFLQSRQANGSTVGLTLR